MKMTYYEFLLRGQPNLFLHRKNDLTQAIPENLTKYSSLPKNYPVWSIYFDRLEESFYPIDGKSRYDKLSWKQDIFFFPKYFIYQSNGSINHLEIFNLKSLQFNYQEIMDESGLEVLNSQSPNKNKFHFVEHVDRVNERSHNIYLAKIFKFINLNLTGFNELILPQSEIYKNFNDYNPPIKEINIQVTDENLDEVKKDVEIFIEKFKQYQDTLSW